MGCFLTVVYVIKHSVRKLIELINPNCLNNKENDITIFYNTRKCMNAAEILMAH